MKKEDKQELKTQVENVLEYSDALHIYTKGRMVNDKQRYPPFLGFPT